MELFVIKYIFFLQHGPLHSIPHEVILWTNHRVMEWLRTIDLSEYAPNLRGSGVHGGLMVRITRKTIRSKIIMRLFEKGQT